MLIFFNYYSHYHNILEPSTTLAFSEVTQLLSYPGSQTQGVYFKLSNLSYGPLCTPKIGFDEKEKGFSLQQYFFFGGLRTYYDTLQINISANPLLHVLIIFDILDLSKS